MVIMKQDFNKLGLCPAFTLPKMTINDEKKFPKFFLWSSDDFIFRRKCFCVKEMLMVMNQMMESDDS